MDVATEAWRVKHPKHWLSGKHGKGDGNVDKEEKEENPKLRKDTTPKEPRSKRERQITLCFHNRKKKFIPLPTTKNPSLCSLAKSCNHTCCNCCAALARYVKEVFRFVYCVVNCNWPCMRFQQMFCELVKATGDLCNDCLDLISGILRIFVGVKN